VGDDIALHLSDDGCAASYAEQREPSQDERKLEQNVMLR